MAVTNLIELLFDKTSMGPFGALENQSKVENALYWATDTKALYQYREGVWRSVSLTNFLNSDSSSVYNVRDYGAIGDGVHDDTDAIRRTIQAAYTGLGAYNPVYLPAGEYRFSNQLSLGDNITFYGDSSRPGNQGGSELIWYGGNGDWIVCGFPATDWSNCIVKNLRLTAGTSPTSGYALRVYNPTNSAILERILAEGAADGQFFIDNADGGANNPGPNFFAMRDIFASGGVTPIRIRGGRQFMTMMHIGIDHGATSTCGISIEDGEGDGFTLSIIGAKVESSLDIIGYLLATNAPVTLLGCCRYYYGAGSAATPSISGTMQVANDRTCAINFTSLACTNHYVRTADAFTIPAGGSGETVTFIQDKLQLTDTDNLSLRDLPTADPGTPGDIWRDPAAGNVLKVSV